MQQSLSNAGYQNLLATGAGTVMFVGIILIGIGSASWPGLLLGGLLGLRTAFSKSSYPSYLGVGHISRPLSDGEFQYEERLSAGIQRRQDRRLITLAMLPYFIGVAVYLAVARPAVARPDLPELAVSALAGWLFIFSQASGVQYVQVLHALYAEWRNEDRGLR